jgi:hypothetical protein
MAEPAARPFKLLDAMVLVAATAVGFGWVRCVWYFNTDWRLNDWLNEAPEMLLALLMVWTLATLFLRLVPPRPRIRRLVSQPGAAACGAVALIFALECSRYFLDSTARSRGVRWILPWARYVPAELFSLISGGPYAYAVVTAWGLLFLSRRCRPEPSWIDRAGRVTGLLWLLLALWSTMKYAIDEWGAAEG